MLWTRYCLRQKTSGDANYNCITAMWKNNILSYFSFTVIWKQHLLHFLSNCWAAVC